MNRNESEQWKLGGNCNACRRKNYCSKNCKAATVRKNRELANLMVKTVAKVMAETAS